MNFPLNGRLLGLDAGTKTIGIALCDAGQSVASPLVTLKRTKWAENADELAALVLDHKVRGLVVGLPLNLDGTLGPRAQASKQLAKNIEKLLGLPVALWDERLSTMAVEKAMLEADLSRQKRKIQVDKLAATYILQAFLDARPRHVQPDPVPDPAR